VVGVADYLVAIQLYEGRIQIVTNNLVLLLLNDQLIWKAKISIKLKGMSVYIYYCCWAATSPSLMYHLDRLDRKMECTLTINKTPCQTTMKIKLTMFPKNITKIVC
jgi:predicted MFS family arabinose efflux permease